MKTIKLVGQIAHVVILLTIVIFNALFYWKNFTHSEKPVPEYIQINDSLRIVQAKVEQFEDSAALYTLITETLYAKKDSVDRLDSTARAGLRESYRARIRAKVAAGL